MISQRLLSGDLAVNDIYQISVEEIIYSDIWTPADWHNADCVYECWEEELYHYDCSDTPFDERWLEIFDTNRHDDRYMPVKKSIKQKGFTAPVTARIGSDNSHIALIDGHHRLTVAYDMQVEIPIFMASHLVSIDNLRAMDSNYWIDGVVDIAPRAMLSWLRYGARNGQNRKESAKRKGTPSTTITLF